MIIKSPFNKKYYWIWNSAIKNPIKWKPTRMRIGFNKYTNQLDMCDDRFFPTWYSMEELEDMLKELKRINASDDIIPK